MSLTLLALPLWALLPLQQGGEWSTSRFERVHLRNGNFVDGALVRDHPLEVTLRLKSGEMVIRRDQIDRVEIMRIRTRTEPPVQVKAPAFRNSTDNRPPVAKQPTIEVVAPGEIKAKVDEMIARLKSSSGDSKRFPIEEIEPLGEEAAVYLASKIRTLPLDCQAAAATAVGLLKAERSVPILEEMITDREAKVRAAGLMALSYMGDDKKLRYLRPALQDADPEVRLVALNLASSIEDKDWFQPLSALCKDPDAAVRTDALAHCNRIAKANNMGDEFLRLVADLLQGADETGRIELANLLGGLSDKRSWELLGNLLGDGSDKVRLAAARGLLFLAAPESGPKIVAALQSETDGKVRVFLAGVAQKLRLRPAVQPLIGWLGDADESVRKAAHTALVGITGQTLGPEADKWSAWADTQNDLK